MMNRYFILVLGSCFFFACSSFDSTDAIKQKKSSIAKDTCKSPIQVKLSIYDVATLSADKHTLQVTNFRATKTGVIEKIGDVYWDCRCPSGTDNGCSWKEDPVNGDKLMHCSGRCVSEHCNAKKISEDKAPEDLSELDVALP